MTHPNRIASQWAALHAIHGSIHDRLDRALAAAWIDTAQHDGHRSTASGADSGPGGSSDHTTVERAVLARLGGDERHPGPVERLAELADLIGAAALAYRHITDIVDRWAPKMTEDDRRRARCIGDGTPEGATCSRYASVSPTTGQANRKGMCEACYARQRRRHNGDAA
jgi:hypothetical protein